MIAHAPDIRAFNTAALAAPVAGPLIEPPVSPRVWGLSAFELHDAFWRSKGVQCVRRGHRGRLQRGADLFLLLEPSQLVLFNIAQISERLTWHSAVVTRLRLVDEADQRYSEHVITDSNGWVNRIERRYRPRVQGSSRVMLSSSRRVARMWMGASGRREGWKRLRRSVPWPRVDHWKCPGVAFVEGLAPSESRFVEELVARWPRPDQTITGLVEIEPGVWQFAGESIKNGAVRIGPLWLGRGSAFDDRRCLVGPSWTQDIDPPDVAGTGLKSIAEVEMPDGPRTFEQRDARRAYALGKRVFRIAGSAGALLVLAPLMALVAVCILVEDGRPLFFGHRRQGRGGTVFRCWKFRTMHRDAEKIARKLRSMNQADGPQVHIPNDPRVTRIGRLLRATNIDELPQFWNVLIGHMSLVGPRPSPDDENQYCPAWRDLRLSVRPGITGLWQLHRTREPGEDFQEWIKFDIQYVQRASLLLDVSILARTVWMLTFKRRTPRAPCPTQ